MTELRTDLPAYDLKEALLPPTKHAAIAKASAELPPLTRREVERICTYASGMSASDLLIAVLRTPTALQALLWGMAAHIGLLTMTAVTLEHESWKVWKENKR